MPRSAHAGVGLVLTLVAWSFCAAGGPQDFPVRIEPRPKPDPARSDTRLVPAATIRVDTDLVLIPVSVADEYGRQVLGLTSAQFRLYDDQVEQAITHFASTDAPMSVAIVFDASGSMGPKLAKSREAVAEILSTANPEDEFALIEFNDRVRRVVGLTNRIEDVRSRLITMEAKGRTALLDAVYLAVSTMKRARHQRKAIVVLSDGGDNSSRYSVSETICMVREADVQVFAMAIGVDFEAPGRMQEEIDGPELLREIAEMTGGRMFPVKRADGLREAAARIGDVLRHQYVLGYTPSNIETDGRCHRVQVRAPGLEGVRLFWRLGYCAPVN